MLLVLQYGNEVSVKFHKLHILKLCIHRDVNEMMKKECLPSNMHTSNCVLFCKYALRKELIQNTGFLNLFISLIKPYVFSYEPPNMYSLYNVEN